METQKHHRYALIKASLFDFFEGYLLYSKPLTGKLPYLLLL